MISSKGTIDRTAMTVTVKKHRVYPKISQEKMSKLSRLFRFLININVFPMKVDMQTKQLFFSFCSTPMLIFSIYMVTLTVLTQIAQG